MTSIEHYAMGKIAHVFRNLDDNTVTKQFRQIEDSHARQVKQLKAGRGSFYLSFMREVECLKRLSGRKNFPVLLDYNEEDMWIKMSYCGEQLPVKPPRQSYPQLIPQIDDIIKDLQECGVKITYERKQKYKEKINNQRISKYYSYFPAQNVLILDGILKLIDFEMAYPEQSELEQFFLDDFRKQFENYNYDKFKQLFVEMLVPDDHTLSDNIYAKQGEFMNKDNTKWNNYQDSRIGNDAEDRKKIFELDKYGGKEKIALDIGANRGKIAESIQNDFKEVHCVEPFADPIKFDNNNIKWHKKTYVEWSRQNDKKFDLIMCFAVSIQIVELDGLQENELVSSIVDHLATGGIVIYESQKVENRPVNKIHVDKMLASFRLQLGPEIKLGPSRAQGLRTFHIFKKN